MSGKIPMTMKKRLVLEILLKFSKYLYSFLPLKILILESCSVVF